MLERLLPRETNFFDFFDKHAQLSIEAAREFQSLVTTAANIESKAKRIAEIEGQADTVTHQCVEALHRTFITPIDRNDIHRLITRLDDVLDLIEGAAERIVLYKLVEMPQEIRDLTDVLVRSTEEVAQAVQGLRSMKSADTVRRICIDINRLENEADSILRNAIARLFENEKNAITVIKWKEIYETLENATDRCEDVANIIEGVVLEHE